ncbi:YezD family protein [Immundisolibacter cernigliae]|jgi:hypothetical protein|uniref:YezD family protein n=1 Tax=Immundisolibacter cernigliae TaxID=1810504 RepID=UPI00096ACEE0|nr:YezD family protein [Immundisolibacter cernigliae]ART40588.1 L112 [uncultured bacterium]
MTSPSPTESLSQEVLRRLSDALRGLRYGAVEITVHDGRVVQIERTEKLRLSSSGEQC